jgi:hypothetical protein
MVDPSGMTFMPSDFYRIMARFVSSAGGDNPDVVAIPGGGRIGLKDVLGGAAAAGLTYCIVRFGVDTCLPKNGPARDDNGPNILFRSATPSTLTPENLGHLERRPGEKGQSVWDTLDGSPEARAFWTPKKWYIEIRASSLPKGSIVPEGPKGHYILKGVSAMQIYRAWAANAFRSGRIPK